MHYSYCFYDNSSENFNDYDITYKYVRNITDNDEQSSHVEMGL